jgi:hypothetical protein
MAADYELGDGWRVHSEDGDPETTAAKADATRLARELRLAAGWHPGGWQGPDASVRYIMSRAREEQRLAAGDVRIPDDALAWLAGNTRIAHEYGDGEPCC